MFSEAKLIDSKNNAFFKQLVKISQNKEKSLCLLEGIHLCQEFLAMANRAHLKAAIFQSSALQKIVDSAASNELLQLYQSIELKPTILAETLFKQLCDVPSPQGVIFLIETPQRAIDDIILTESMVLIDRVQDPGNLGTIIRTMAAAGIKQLVLSNGTVRAWSNKVLRSAQGAHFALNIFSDVDLQHLISGLSIPVYAAALSERAASLYDMTLAGECAWLFGNEGRGVSKALLSQATEEVFIPQSEAVESLNVAVACGIILFEQRRQRLTQINAK
ncbi:23S rRNA (guanosine-2'-O-)-methyltransferase RlmB [Oligella sp. MSHR50489EDL]